MLFVAGMISIPNIIFFSGDDYTGGTNSLGVEEKGFRQSSITIKNLIGSAMCTSKEWAFAESDMDTGNVTDTDMRWENGRLEVLVSSCDGATLKTGLVNLAAVLFTVLATFLLGLYQEKKFVFEDESVQTVADYSLIVTNPPNDAIDPDIWRNYFNTWEDNGKGVTCCTVKLNNHELLNVLVELKVLQKKLSLLIPSEIDIDDESAVNNIIRTSDEHVSHKSFLSLLFSNWVIKPTSQLFGISIPPIEMVKRINDLKKEIIDLETIEYKATSIYVTFETEKGLRDALNALKVEKFHAYFQKKNKEIEQHLFRGETLLYVKPSYEPESICWINLHHSLLIRTTWQCVTMISTIGFILAAAFLAKTAREASLIGGSILVSLFNVIAPEILTIMSYFEKNHTEGARQSSLYLRITIFRWANTAIMIALLTKMTDTLTTNIEHGLLNSVNVILLSELIFVPLFRYLDIFGNLKKHYLAPRAQTQEEMNLHFIGGDYNLAERYTDLTKVVFVCYFYNALMPSAFFFGSVILTVQYYVDKFCLIRIWFQAPEAGIKVARKSNFFFSLASVIGVMSSSYYWARFRFDDMCLSSKNEIYNCNTDFDYFDFPYVSRIQKNEKWMSREQEKLSDIYGWTSVVVMTCFFIQFSAAGILKIVKRFVFEMDNKVFAQDQFIDFSSIMEKNVFIPNILCKDFVQPLLICDITNIDSDLLPRNYFVKDSEESYDTYNLVHDFLRIKSVLNKEPCNENRVKMYTDNEIHASALRSRQFFDQVKYWPQGELNK